MLEVLLGVGLGLLLASNIALWLKLDRCYQDLGAKLSDSQTVIESKVDIGSIKNEIAETIEDFMGNLQVPTAQDHLLGGLSQIMQMWAMKRFGPVVAQMQSQLQDEQL
tara:strand:+ start:3568 stop:3891 length:324 start_codon:yes stop_codon:yes gene_type:complete